DGIRGAHHRVRVGDSAGDRRRDGAGDPRQRFPLRPVPRRRHPSGRLQDGVRPPVGERHDADRRRRRDLARLLPAVGHQIEREARQGPFPPRSRRPARGLYGSRQAPRHHGRERAAARHRPGAGEGVKATRRCAPGTPWSALRSSLVALLLIAGAGLGQAQDYPTRPVRIVVPYVAGGGTDAIARILAKGLEQRLGQPFVVENRGGSGTTLGGAQVARSEPDGYTLLMATSATLAIAPALYKKLPYDAAKDFTPISLIAT